MGHAKRSGCSPGRHGTDLYCAEWHMQTQTTPPPPPPSLHCHARLACRGQDGKACRGLQARLEEKQLAEAEREYQERRQLQALASRKAPSLVRHPWDRNPRSSSRSRSPSRGAIPLTPHSPEQPAGPPSDDPHHRQRPHRPLIVINHNRMIELNSDRIETIRQMLDDDDDDDADSSSGLDVRPWPRPANGRFPQYGSASTGRSLRDTAQGEGAGEVTFPDLDRMRDLPLAPPHRLRPPGEAEVLDADQLQHLAHIYFDPRAHHGLPMWLYDPEHFLNAGSLPTLSAFEHMDPAHRMTVVIKLTEALASCSKPDLLSEGRRLQNVCRDNPRVRQAQKPIFSEIMRRVSLASIPWDTTTQRLADYKACMAGHSGSTQPRSLDAPGSTPLKQQKDPQRKASKTVISSPAASMPDRCYLHCIFSNAPRPACSLSRDAAGSATVSLSCSCSHLF